MSIPRNVGSAILVAVLGGVLAGIGEAQTENSSGFDVSSASAAELLAEADRLERAHELTDEIASAIGDRAVQLLLSEEVDLNDASTNPTWSRLVELAKPVLDELSEEDKQLLMNAMANAPIAPATTDFSRLQCRVLLMQAAGSPRIAIRGLVEAWAQSQGLDQLAVTKAKWCLEQILPQLAERKEFSVVWTGELTAPSTGQYTFSVSPINVNKAVGDESVQHTMAVWVDGVQVIDATAANWNWLGQPMQLQADEPVTVNVSMTYSASHPTYSDSPHALLYWQGPGISRQIVPGSVLTLPNGGGSGLQADYAWTEVSQAQSVVQSCPNIEFAWASCRDVAPRNPGLVTALVQRLWQLVSAPTNIDPESPDQLSYDAQVFYRNYFCAQFLTCDQRRQFAQLLVQSPELLDSVDETQVLRLYGLLRFGDQNAALDLLGTWMQLRADAERNLSLDYFKDNHRFYRTAALYLVWRASEPDMDVSFQNRFLEMPDGRCCLPVAYTLAHCSLMRDRIEEWLEFLDSKLADESITGDRRLNWLLARAVAEELRSSSPDRSYFPTITISDSQPWIDEASMVAEGESSRTRVAKERISRLVGLRQWNTLDGELSQLQQAPGEMATLATAWKSKIDGLQAELVRQEQQSRESAFQKYADDLRRRRANAVSNGNSAALTRYDELIEAAESDLSDDNAQTSN